MGKVIQEHFEHLNFQPSVELWKKGEPDTEGYFTLEHHKVTKFLTAISASNLEIKDPYEHLKHSGT